MNKQIVAALMAVGFGLSAGVASAATAFTGNTQVDSTECALLAEEVTLGVSASVHGGYFCSEEDNVVEVAACHEGGSRQQGVACSTDADTETVEIELPEGCEDNTGFSTTPDYKAFGTSSRGGVMQEYQLGARCSATTIVGIDGFSG